MGSDAASPLLSIVIATKNRIPWAQEAIRSVLAIGDPQLELVVQDNSDTRELEESLQRDVSDRRFRYRYTPPPFSSIDNFNSAMELATGQYVCLIGDDDGINPEILEAARWAEANDVDAIKPEKIVDYLWPGISLVSMTAKTSGGTMTILPFSSAIRDGDVSSDLRRLISNGGQDYLRTDLPRVYHGVVRRECLERVRERTGHYFGGLSPDIYAVATVSQTVRRVVCVDYPLTISGACPASTSVAHHTGKHVGNLSDAPHFRDRGDYRWAQIVPGFYSVETIWADSLACALSEIHRDDLLQQFNVAILAAYCLARHPRFHRIIFADFYRALRLRGESRAFGTVRLAAGLWNGPSRAFLRRVLRRMRSVFRGSQAEQFSGLSDIAAAQKALTQHLVAKGRRFADCVS